jgi:hypothetical protein
MENINKQTITSVKIYEINFCRHGGKPLLVPFSNLIFKEEIEIIISSFF